MSCRYIDSSPVLIRINGHSILLLEQTKSSIWTMDMHIGSRIRSLDCVLECGVLVRCCNDQITPIWLYLSPDWLRILVPTCPPYFPPPPPRPARHLRRDVTWSRFGGAGHSSIHTPHRAAAGPHFYNVRYSMGTGGVWWRTIIEMIGKYCLDILRTLPGKSVSLGSVPS